MEWVSLKELVAQTGIAQARLVRAGKDGGLVDGKSILMRGQGQNIEWAIRPAGMVMADEAALRESLAACLHCSAPASKRTGKMCGVCNREALKEYKTAYKGPQYSESVPAPPEAFEVTGGMCSIKCPVCATLFMEAGPNDADVLASGPGTCDCGAEFNVEWDGGAYVTTAVPMPVEDPIPTFGRPVDDNTAAKFVEPAPSTKPVVEREIAKRVITKDRVHPMLPSCKLLAKTEAH